MDLGISRETSAEVPRIRTVYSNEDLQSSNVEPFVIGVAGASASGKTSVCEKIIHGLGDHRCVLLSLDWYYHGLPQGVEPKDYNFDHPDAFDFSALTQTLRQMKERVPVTVPTYDFTTHSRSGEVVVSAADVIIVEGILTFYESWTREIMHMKIFVDEDPDVCLCRRIRRDVAHRGRTIEDVLAQYEKFVKPSYDRFIFPLKRYADIIIPRGAENYVAIDLIVKHIALKLRQEDLSKLFPNLLIMRDNVQIRGLHTIFRDRSASREDFIFYVNRLMRLVVEEGLGLLTFSRAIVQTPAEEPYYGVKLTQDVIGVSLIRGGEAMEESLRAVCKTAVIAKMMISAEGQHRTVVYEQLPYTIEGKQILLMDPVLDSGKTTCRAIERLIEVGALESQIIVLNVIASPQAARCVCSTFPGVRFVTSAIDRGVSRDGGVLPGIGDFANRYFGT